MYIIYDLDDNVISICSSKRTLMIKINELTMGEFRVELWDDCPEGIKSYLARI